MAREEVRTPRLSVQPSPLGGRGVFAERHYAPGELIERAPVLVLPAEQKAHIAATVLGNYYFEWNETGQGDIAIGLGHASIYNHSYSPTARYAKNREGLFLEYRALQPIAPGDEITVNYNGDPRDRAPVWFEPADESAEPPSPLLAPGA